MNRKGLAILLSIICVVAVALLFGYRKRGTSRNPDRRPLSASLGVQPSPVRLPPPTWDEVESAVHRVFGDNLVLEQGASPAFIVGDFNGDQSEDLAVIVRAAPGRLAELNDRAANWSIQDADNFFVPPADSRVVTPPAIAPARLVRGEQVLAIIHGYGAQGWRSSEARQAYLVRHGAATLLGTAPSVNQEAVRAMRLPVTTEIIQEVRDNRKGFLFWTGAAYAWHPVQG